MSPPRPSTPRPAKWGRMAPRAIGRAVSSGLLLWAACGGVAHSADLTFTVLGDCRPGTAHYSITGGAGAPLYARPARGGLYHYVLVTATGTAYNPRMMRV